MPAEALLTKRANHTSKCYLLDNLMFLAFQLPNKELRNTQMRTKKLSAELSYLNAQVNPHFLFNTLNNIYSLSLSQSERVPEAILKLSDIMRYSIREGQANKVPLSKEIEYIENYIALQQLKSNQHLMVTFNITGDIEGYHIVPLLLINFIENAFKYGVSNHFPCFVNIQISVKDNQLILLVNNKKMIAPEKEKISIGMHNTKRRLQLQYPDNHELAINDQKEFYEINLVINLV